MAWGIDIVKFHWLGVRDMIMHPKIHQDLLESSLNSKLGNSWLTEWSVHGSVPPWCGQSSSPEGFTLVASATTTGVGKNFLVCSTSKAMVCGQLISRSYGATVCGWVGIRGFSQSTWEDLLLKPEYLGLSSHHESSFFYSKLGDNFILIKNRLYMVSAGSVPLP